MSRLKPFVRKHYPVMIPLILFLILELPFLNNSRPALTDESFYSNPAYNFIHGHSFINTNIGYGGNGLITYTLYLSSFFLILGTSLFTARLSSVILGIISIFILRKMFKILEASEFNVLLSLSFFILSNNYLSVFKFARPEALTITLCLLLLLSLYYYIRNGYSTKYLFIILLLTFAITNSHPFGSLIITAAGIIILFFIIKERRYVKIYHPALLVIGYVLSLLFVVFLISVSNGISFGESLLIVSDRSSSDSFTARLIEKIKITIDYYVLSNRIVTFLPHIFMLTAGLFFARRNRNVFYLTLLGFLTIITAYVTLSSSMFSNTFVYFFIFSTIALPLMLGSIKSNKYIYNSVVVFIALTVILNIAAYSVLTYKSFDPSIGRKNKEIVSLIPNGAKIISGPAFWFIDPAKEIREWGYYYRDPAQIRTDDFYLITYEIDKSEKRQLVDSIVRNNTHTIDTLLKINSRTYGNTDLIKLTLKKQ
ncbi:MAG TPA: hypothetical protein VN514_10085 [Ignavibacteria bacterium]|nr:hypothetical protein [Ignavibacteria bacterium]